MEEQDLQGGAPAPQTPNAAAPIAQDGGAVELTIPKPLFDQIHTLVIQAAAALSQVKQGVDSQAQAKAQAPAAPEQALGAPAGAGRTSADEDEEFLKSIANSR
jgi:hypothetical protein